MRVELVGKSSSQVCSPQFSFKLTRRHGGGDSNFAFCNYTEQVDEIDLIGEARLLVLGRAAASAPVASILDLPSGKIVDHFMCFMPAVSPDHHFLAFVKSFPGHPGPVEISAEYLVYDLTRSPEDNRHVPNSLDSDAGQVAYPVGAPNTPGSNILPEGQPYHRWASRGLFWIDRLKFAFGDEFGGHTALVVVGHPPALS